MKTKEIDVWVDPQFGTGKREGLIFARRGTCISFKNEGEKYTKAKLIIEIPEPVKQFTASEVREAVAKCIGHALDSRRVTNIITELFGEEE